MAVWLLLLLLTALCATLHAGYRIDFVEKYFPLVWLNTSIKHNRHHEKTRNYYGEISYFWVHTSILVYLHPCTVGSHPGTLPLRGDAGSERVLA